MRRHFLIGLMMFFAAATGARATFGGPQTIEVLGFDARSAEIVFLRYFHDELDHDTEALPQLYRLSIAPNAAPVKVDSRFFGAWRRAKEQAGERYDFRENDAGFHESMRVLKASLAASTPLTPVDTRLRVTTNRRFVENTADEDVVGWSLSVELAIDGSIGVGRVTNYCDRAVRLQRCLSLPKPGLSIAVVSHKGVPQEGCYDTEDIVVLRRKARER